MPAAAAPALGLATVAGLYCRCKEGRMTDRRCQLLFSRPRRKHVVSRERSVGAFGIRYLKLGIRGRAFAGCTFVRAVVRVQVSLGHRCRMYCRVWHTFKSSQVVNFLTRSPTSLNPLRDSSRRSLTLSLTRSVSRFVPRRLIC